MHECSKKLKNIGRCWTSRQWLTRKKKAGVCLYADDKLTKHACRQSPGDSRHFSHRLRLSRSAPAASNIRGRARKMHHKRRRNTVIDLTRTAKEQLPLQASVVIDQQETRQRRQNSASASHFVLVRLTQGHSRSYIFRNSRYNIAQAYVIFSLCGTSLPLNTCRFSRQLQYNTKLTLNISQMKNNRRLLHRRGNSV